MIRQKRPEVHLEVCGGFFRIPTDKVVYNITVLDSPKIGATSVPAGIVHAESFEPQVEIERPFVGDVTDGNTVLPTGDTYYKNAAVYYSGEFRRLLDDQGDSLPDDSGDSWKHVLENLDQTNKIVEQGKVLLNDMQSIPPLEDGQEDSPEKSAGMAALTAGVAEAQANTGSLKNIISELFEKNKVQAAAPVASAPLAKQSIKKLRYLFDLDTVFQTIYELCTNETVKEHSQKARAAADDIFDKEAFLDYISERIGTYSEDDGFFSIPLTDVLTGLAQVCSDNKTANLLKNMDKNQADIFLDQFLPLEVPPTEEIEVEGEVRQTEDREAEQAPAETPALDPLLEEARNLIGTLEETLGSLAAIQIEPSNSSVGSDLGETQRIKLEEVANIFADIGANMHLVREEIGKQSVAPVSSGESSHVLHEVKNTAEAFASCLANKNENPELSFVPDGQSDDAVLTEEEIAASVPEISNENLETTGDETIPDSTDIISEISNENDGDFDEHLELSGDDLADDDLDEEFGEASQDDIDKLLADMGG